MPSPAKSAAVAKTPKVQRTGGARGVLINAHLHGYRSNRVAGDAFDGSMRHRVQSIATEYMWTPCRNGFGCSGGTNGYVHLDSLGMGNGHVGVPYLYCLEGKFVS